MIAHDQFQPTEETPLRNCAIAILMMAMSLTTTANAASDQELAAATLAMEQEQQTIDLAAAVIRSQSDLQNYLLTTTNSALHRVPASARQMFIDSLMFTPHGLGSYSYIPLQSLSVTEIHQILSLFGVQTSLEAIPGLRARSAAGAPHAASDESPRATKLPVSHG